jgi:hypothetical protein
MIQFVMNTKRFQPKATVADDTGVAEGIDEIAGDGEEASVAREVGESDDNVGRSL